MKFIDLTGQKFGNLTVVKYIGNRNWECKCDCGNVTTVKGYNLKNGHTKSCGCLSKQQARINGKNTIMDLTNKRFGNLTVVKYVDNSKWLCQCDCGNTTIVSQSNLCRQTKPTKSCGCLVTLDEANNRNIVEDTNVGNIRSTTLSKRNTTGVKGVCYLKSRGMYQAYITFQKRQYVLLTSSSFEKCVEARKKAEKNIFGDFLKWYDENYKKDK